MGQSGSCISTPSRRCTPIRDFYGGEGNCEPMQLAFAYGTMQGWRDFNEDCSFALPSLGHAVKQSGLLKDPSGLSAAWDGVAAFGVLDGHGGEQVARFCQRHLPPAIAAASSASQSTSSLHGIDIGASLSEAFFRMDELLRDVAFEEELQSLVDESRPWKVQSPAVTGATACVCCVEDERLIVANAGDCRAVLCRGGQAMDLSQDHCPALEKEARRIFNAGGRLQETKLKKGTTMYRINGDINVSRAIGDLGYKKNASLSQREQLLSAEPDIRAIDRSADDEFVIIACDGVWNMMSSDEVVQFVQDRLHGDDSCLRLSPARTTHQRYQQIVEDLLDACISPNLVSTGGLGGDNVTAILVVFDAEPPEGSDEESVESSPC